jgi:hypothetical protein
VYLRWGGQIEFPKLAILLMAVLSTPFASEVTHRVITSNKKNAISKVYTTFYTD